MFAIRMFNREVFACGKTQATQRPAVCKSAPKAVSKPVVKTAPVRVKKTRQLLGLSKSQWKRMKRKPGFDPWMP